MTGELIAIGAAGALLSTGSLTMAAVETLKLARQTIGRSLAAVYDPVAAEPLPLELAELAATLKEVDHAAD